MNIIQLRQEKRAGQILDIKNSIQKAIDKGKELDFKTIVMATSSNLGLSIRTSQEYVEIALFQLKLKKEDLDGNTK